jgi:hypothetical protein
MNTINYDNYPSDQQLRTLCLLYHEEGREVTPIEVIEFCVAQSNTHGFGIIRTPRTQAQRLIRNPRRLAIWDHYHRELDRKK